MNVHLPDENTMIDKSCIDMWESVNVWFYLAALERKKKRKKKISKEVLQQLVLLVDFRLPHEIRI